MGSIYRPKYIDRHGEERESSIWWIAYYSSGRLIREGTDTSDYEEAKRELKKREGAAVDWPVKTSTRVIRFRDLAEDVIQDYVVNDRKSERDVRQRFKDHILPEFGQSRAVSIDTASIRKYITRRREEGAAKATVNRELAAIKRAFNLGIQAEKITHKPHIPMLDEKDNVRQGFFEDDQFAALLRHLSDDYAAIARFARVTGWRKGNVHQIKWPQVDFENGFVSLEPGTTKNKKAIKFPLTDELRLILSEQRHKADQLKKQGIICPFVFFHFRTLANGKPSKFNGKPIRDIKKAWDKARKAAGIPRHLMHDFRRTAVRTLDRAGIPEQIAMQMTGHQTRSVFDRYNIVNETDLTEAGEKLNGYSRKAFKDGALRKA
jgi:integrase